MFVTRDRNVKKILRIQRKYWINIKAISFFDQGQKRKKTNLFGAMNTIQIIGN